MDDRDSRSSTVAATHLPVAERQGRSPDPTIDDAILDHLVDYAYRLTPGRKIAAQTRFTFAQANQLKVEYRC